MGKDKERMEVLNVYNNVNFENSNEYSVKNNKNSDINSGDVKKSRFMNIVNTSKLLKDLIFMSFMQMIILGVIIFLMERFNLLFLYVTTFINIIYITELALTFFFLFLFIDVITESILRIFRMKILKQSKNDNMYNYNLFIILFESLLQTLIFIVINVILHSIGLFGVYIRNSSGTNVSIEIFYILVFIAVFFVECFTEGLKSISTNLIKKQI